MNLTKLLGDFTETIFFKVLCKPCGVVPTCCCVTKSSVIVVTGSCFLGHPGSSGFWAGSEM